MTSLSTAANASPALPKSYGGLPAREASREASAGRSRFNTCSPNVRSVCLAATKRASPRCAPLARLVAPRRRRAPSTFWTDQRPVCGCALSMLLTPSTCWSSTPAGSRGTGPIVPCRGIGRAADVIRPSGSQRPGLCRPSSAFGLSHRERRIRPGQPYAAVTREPPPACARLMSMKSRHTFYASSLERRPCAPSTSQVRPPAVNSAART